MKSKHSFLPAVLMLAVASLTAPAFAQDAPTTNRLVIRFKASAAPAAMTANAQGVTADHQGRAKALSVSGAIGELQALRVSGTGAVVYQLNKPVSLAEAADAARRIVATRPDVLSAEPDRWVKTQQLAQTAAATPNDTYASVQWALQPSSATNRGGANFLTAWAQSTGRLITIAVIDTGYVSHADLSVNSYDSGGYDFVSADTGGTTYNSAGDSNGRDGDASDPGDYCTSTNSNSTWHGLHVAGQIAAVANNGMGIAGAAYGAKVLPVRALGRCGGWMSDIADAITWSVGGAVPGTPMNAVPARVINLSIGGTPGDACPSFMQDAVNYAVNTKKAVVVAAAGNAGAGSVGSPANCAGVIVVGAHTLSGDLADYSNHSAEVTLTAPGGGACKSQAATCVNTPMVSLGNSGTQSLGSNKDSDYWAGTSAATPNVSAAAALMLSVNSSLTPAQVASVLKSSANKNWPADSYCATHSTECGAGMLDAAAAVSSVAAPVVTISGPTAAVASGSNVSFTATSTGVAPFVYSWRQVSGPTVALTGNDTATVSFKAPTTATKANPVTLEVTVSTGYGLASKADTYLSVNNPPVLTSKLINAAAGARMQSLLDGFDADGDTVTYTLISGPDGMTVSSGALVWTNPVPGTYSAKVQPSDGQADGSVVDLTVVVAASQGSGSGSVSAGGSSGGGGGSMSLWGLLLLAAATFAAGRARKD